MRATDQEQIDMLKEWWKTYGKPITYAIIIGLILGFGWRYWRQTQVSYAERASLIYQNMLLADAKNDASAANLYANLLLDKYSKSTYATFAALMSAKNNIPKNVPLATERLNWVLKNSKIPSLKQIARLRLARIYISQNNTSEALNILNTVNDESYKPLIAQLKGDAYAASGNKAAAELAYQEAQKNYSAVGLADPLLNMKLADGADSPSVP